MADETDCRVETLEVEIVLQAHRQAVQGAQRFPSSCQILVSGFGRLQSPSKASLGQAVRLHSCVSGLPTGSWGADGSYQYMSGGCAFAKGLGHIH